MELSGEQLSLFDDLPELGSYVDIVGREIDFDELPGLIGHEIILDRSTESHTWYVVIRVLDVVFNDYEQCRRLVYSDGSRQHGLIDERYFRRGGYCWSRSRVYELPGGDA